MYLDFDSPLNLSGKCQVMPGLFQFRGGRLQYRGSGRLCIWLSIPACLIPPGARDLRSTLMPGISYKHLFCNVLEAAHPRSSQLCTAGKVLDEIFMIGAARIRMLKMTWQRS